MLEVSAECGLQLSDSENLAAIKVSCIEEQNLKLQLNFHSGKHSEIMFLT